MSACVFVAFFFYSSFFFVFLCCTWLLRPCDEECGRKPCRSNIMCLQYALLEVWCLFAPELRRDCLHSLAESFPSSLNQLFSTFDLKLPSGDRCGCLLDENSKQLPALSSLSNLLRLRVCLCARLLDYLFACLLVHFISAQQQAEGLACMVLLRPFYVLPH